MYYRLALTALVITYLICVLVLSGMQKEDLNAHTLKKLRQHNLDLQSLKNETVRQECYKSKIADSIANHQKPAEYIETNIGTTETVKATKNPENLPNSDKFSEFGKLMLRFKNLLNNSDIMKSTEGTNFKINITTQSFERNEMKSPNDDKTPHIEYIKKIIEMLSSLKQPSRMLSQQVSTEKVNTAQQSKKTENPEKITKENKIKANQLHSNDIFLTKSISNSNIQGVNKVFIEEYFSNHKKISTATTTERSEYQTIKVIKQLNHILENQDELKLFEQIKSLAKQNSGLQPNRILNYNALHHTRNSKPKFVQKYSESNEYSAEVTTSQPVTTTDERKDLTKLYHIPANVLQEITNNVRDTIMNNLKKVSLTTCTQNPLEDIGDNNKLTRDNFQEILTMLKNSILRDAKKGTQYGDKHKTETTIDPSQSVNNIDNDPKEISPEIIEASPQSDPDMKVKQRETQYQEPTMKNPNFINFLLDFQKMLNENRINHENRVVNKDDMPMSSNPGIFKGPAIDFRENESPLKYRAYAETEIYKKLNENHINHENRVVNKDDMPMSSNFGIFKGPATDFRENESPLKYRAYAETEIYKKYQYNMASDFIDYAGQLLPLEKVASEFKATWPVESTHSYKSYPYNVRSVVQNYLAPTNAINSTQDNNLNLYKAFQQNNADPSMAKLYDINKINDDTYNMARKTNNYPQGELNITTLENGNIKISGHFSEQRPNIAYNNYPISFKNYPPEMLRFNSTEINNNDNSYPLAYESQMQDQVTIKEEISTKSVEPTVPLIVTSTTTNAPTKSPETKQVLDKLTQLFDQINTLKEKIDKPGPHVKLSKTKIFAHNYVAESNMKSDTLSNDPKLDPYVNLYATMIKMPSPRYVNAMMIQTNSDSIPPLGIPITLNRSPFGHMVENQNIIVQSTPSSSVDDCATASPQHKTRCEQKYSKQLTKDNPNRLPDNDDANYDSKKYHKSIPISYSQRHKLSRLAELGRQLPHNFAYPRSLRDPDNYPPGASRFRNPPDAETYQSQHYYQRSPPRLDSDYQSARAEPQSQDAYRSDTYDTQDISSKVTKYRQEDNAKRPGAYRPNVMQKQDERSESRERERKDGSQEKSGRLKVPQRNQIPLKKRPSKYDDTHFKNFLKTQQKVNAMLERILATKVPASVIL